MREALAESIRRARIAHEAQRRETVNTQVVPGGTVTEKWVPVRRVGLYVPGGLAVYPSSVVMNVVPAQVAGVASIAVFSPAQKEFGGLPHPTILAACALLGVDEVYAVGGAQAVALAAYGDPSWGIEPVDVITGPGNVYVAAAKRLVRGVVGIDAEAGPTEIAVLADATADPVHVAADLISQAEHDTAGRLGAGHRLGGAGRRGRRRGRAAGGAHQARRAGQRRARPGRSRRSCWCATSSRACGSSTPTPPSTSRSSPRTPGSGPSG